MSVLAVLRHVDRLHCRELGAQRLDLGQRSTGKAQIRRESAWCWEYAVVVGNGTLNLCFEVAHDAPNFRFFSSAERLRSHARQILRFRYMRVFSSVYS